MATTNKSETDAQTAEHARRQREAAKIHDENVKKAQEQNPEFVTSAEPTSKEHTGKAVGEGHKPDEDVSALGGEVPAKAPKKGKK